MLASPTLASVTDRLLKPIVDVDVELGHLDGAAIAAVEADRT